MRPGEFWEITPADFDRMQEAYAEQQDARAWPMRELQAAIWNVQLAKVGAAQIEPIQLYSLPTIDKHLKKGKYVKSQPPGPKIMSREEYLKRIQEINAKSAVATSPDVPVEDPRVTQNADHIIAPHLKK